MLYTCNIANITNTCIACALNDLIEYRTARQKKKKNKRKKIDCIDIFQLSLKKNILLIKKKIVFTRPLNVVTLNIIILVSVEYTQCNNVI